MKDREILFWMLIERQLCVAEYFLFVNRVKILRKGTNVEKIRDYERRIEDIRKDIIELNESVDQAGMFVKEREQMGITS
jgi:hypothetical protein